MPKIKINKALNRPDGGVVSAGSIAICNNPQQLVTSKQVVFLTNFYITQTAFDNGKTSIPQLDKFPSMKLIKQCSEEEWTQLEVNAGAGELIATFMQECIDEAIGGGSTEIII